MLATVDPPDVTLVVTEPDFVVIDVETACSLVSSIYQIEIVGFRELAELPSPCGTEAIRAKA